LGCLGEFLSVNEIDLHRSGSCEAEKGDGDEQKLESHFVLEWEGFWEVGQI